MDGAAAYIPLTWWDLALGSLLVVANAGLSLALDLGLHKRLAISSLRMLVQLFLMGLVLTTLFKLLSPGLTALAVLVMVGFAGREVSARQDRRLKGLWSYGLGTASMMLAALLVTVLALTTAQVAALGTGQVVAMVTRDVASLTTALKLTNLGTTVCVCSCSC